LFVDFKRSLSSCSQEAHASSLPYGVQILAAFCDRGELEATEAFNIRTRPLSSLSSDNYGQVR
jgi:hypothetical protein